MDLRLPRTCPFVPFRAGLPPVVPPLWPEGPASPSGKRVATQGYTETGRIPPRTARWSVISGRRSARAGCCALARGRAPSLTVWVPLANGPSPNSEVPHRHRRAEHLVLSRKRVHKG
jgi:hypothetical protein